MEAIAARAQLQRDVAQLRAEVAHHAKDTRGRQLEHEKELQGARKAQASQ